jgi:Holliday junction resolvase-like predicted endonuclease
LNAGDCDLADRGYAFEDYISNFLKKETLSEFAKFELIENKNFTFTDSEKNCKSEEIDLVLKTDTTIILAEIKCTTYPFEAIDYHKSFQVIKKAKKQIDRKAKFIENNWEHFESNLGFRNNRKIEKIIIINFPHFAGRNIKGTPIADFYLFLSYFKMGKLSNLKIEKGKAPIMSYIPYYSSIKSFESNFTSFFLKPIPINEIIARQRIEKFEVTLKGTKPKTTAERVVYNPKV